ncbi:MAG TPA: hypothetical protein VNX67_07985 [Solirubrobacteraceae bacterium]|jgi:hypothetical protein|nr:hypothetical protein [Solirubrobacteraceae bacterium]
MMIEESETPDVGSQPDVAADALAERRARHADPAVIRRAEAAEAVARNLETHLAALEQRIEEVGRERERVAQQLSERETDVRSVKQREYAEQQLRVEAEERSDRLQREMRTQIQELSARLQETELHVQELKAELTHLRERDARLTPIVRELMDVAAGLRAGFERELTTLREELQQQVVWERETYVRELTAMGARMEDLRFELTRTAADLRAQLAAEPPDPSLLQHTTEPASEREPAHRREMADALVAAVERLRARVAEVKEAEATQAPDAALAEHVPAAVEEPKRIAPEEPVTVEEEHSIVVEEPAAAEDPESLPLGDPEPVAVEEPEPIAVEPSEPLLADTPEPIAVEEPQPLVVQEPAAGDELDAAAVEVAVEESGTTAAEEPAATEESAVAEESVEVEVEAEGLAVPVAAVERLAPAEPAVPGLGPGGAVSTKAVVTEPIALQSRLLSVPEKRLSWLAPAIRRLAAQRDAKLAAELVIELIPAQRELVDGPVNYEIKIGELGTFYVTLEPGQATISREPRGSVDFSLEGPVAAFGELAAGGAGRRYPGLRMRKGKRRARRFLKTRRRPIALADLASAGVDVWPGLLLLAMAEAIDASWTTGRRFELAFDIEDTPGVVIYVRVCDGESIKVSRTAVGQPVATISLSGHALICLLAGTQPPPQDRTLVSGDVTSVDMFLQWTARAQGLSVADA